ncbi:MULTISPECIES: hypothetical protein [Rodentibacter]|uniref:hypothetical protein n=1 Tax=Rodentibacter TaxID=1960084 RepID=UPI001CFCF8DE|nr:hypothetical protein [Rodentibacter sp. JRC1]GJI55903.1 hypothetical protein HEMROJRC1_10150 [Rodentibacter sp. JRC1]
MFKEKGYDEFLAEKIRRSEEDIKAGRVYTLEEARSKWQQTIERKAVELAELEEQQHEGVYA